MVNFSRTCIHPQNLKQWKKNICFHCFGFWRGMQVPPKLTNFNFFLIFWKYNSNPLTYIFNLAKRQIQKKLCRPFKLSHFFGKFWQKWPKMRFSNIKMVKNIIFGLISWNNHHTRCAAYTLVNSQKKLFLKLGNFSTHYSSFKCIYKTYILRIFGSCKNFEMKLPNFKFFFIFANFCVCSLAFISPLREDKNSLAYAHLNLSIKNSQFLYTKTETTITPARYILSFPQPCHHIILD